MLNGRVGKWHWPAPPIPREESLGILPLREMLWEEKNLYLITQTFFRLLLPCCLPLGFFLHSFWEEHSALQTLSQQNLLTFKTPVFKLHWLQTKISLFHFLSQYLSENILLVYFHMCSSLSLTFLFYALAIYFSPKAHIWTYYILWCGLFFLVYLRTELRPYRTSLSAWAMFVCLYGCITMVVCLYVTQFPLLYKL